MSLLQDCYNKALDSGRSHAEFIVEEDIDGNTARKLAYGYDKYTDERKKLCECLNPPSGFTITMGDKEYNLADIDNDIKKFSTGAVRSKDKDHVRYDLLSPIGLRRYAETMKEGADKYSDFNWEKGMPVSDLLNHAIDHIYAYLSGERLTDEQRKLESADKPFEDHLAHAAWNLMAALHSEESWPDLNTNLRPIKKQ